jgi:hypothetical protein
LGLGEACARPPQCEAAPPAGSGDGAAFKEKSQENKKLDRRSGEGAEA